MEEVNVSFFGKDPKVVKNLKFAGNIAVTKAPVLISGEEGVGKKAMAKYIHQTSNRKNKSLIFVDCSKDEKDVENEILGYHHDETRRFVKGALEMGNEGSVVFVNIDALCESFQKRLFQIFSELSDYDIDVRIMATTTKNLSKSVNTNKFYRELFLIFSSAQISMTSLRERLSDIDYLSSEVLSNICKDKNAFVPVIEEGAKKKLLAHYWTYNVDELIKIMKESYDNSNKEIITMNDLALGDRRVVHNVVGNEGDLKLMSLRDAEKILIEKALVHTSENRTQAAKILGVSIRTLRNKINEYRSEGSQFFLNLR